MNAIDFSVPLPDDVSAPTRQGFVDRHWAWAHVTIPSLPSSPPARPRRSAASAPAACPRRARREVRHRQVQQHRRKGWVASSIRDILANEAYIGWWTWRKRRWVRDPDSGRQPRSRAADEVMRREFPDRRIIEQQLWDRVRARAAGVSAKYKGKGKRGTPGHKTVYPLSGVLICARCKAPMTIMRGTSASVGASQGSRGSDEVPAK